MTNLQKLKKAIKAYYAGEPIMSDKDYDALYDITKHEFPNDKLFKSVGTDVSSNKVKLTSKRGSLVKANPDSALDWIKEKHENFVITPKYDGLSITFEYDKSGNFLRATTRGNGTVGEDVSDRATYFKGFKSHISPKSKITYVTGEAIISQKDFKKYEDKFAMARNLCVGKLKSKLTAAQYRLKLKAEDLQVLKDITFVAYTTNLAQKSKSLEYLKKLGFVTAKILYQGRKITSKLLTDLLKKRDDNFDCDGIVIDVDSKTCVEDYGYESDNITPAYAIAVKPTKEQQDSAEAKIAKIDWQMSRTGNLTPVAKLVNPVVLRGATIKSISLANYDRCKAEGFGEGATVRIVRSGDVIPYADVLKPVKFKVSNKCPYCGHKLVKRGAHLHCSNTKCKGKNIAALQSFFGKLDPENVSSETILALYNEGHDTIAKILTLKKDDLLKLDKFADKKATNFVKQMKKIRHCSLVDFMVACGNFSDGKTSIGKTILESMYEELGAKLTTELTAKQLSKLPHFGTGRVKLYLQCQDAWLKQYNKLSRYFTFTEKKKVQGKLTGKVFCWTGFRDKELKELIESNGGIMKDGLRKDVQALFAAQPSNKTRKAEKDGIQIIAQADAYDYINKLLK